MRLLTDRAVLVCAHETGLVGIAASQTLVSISGHRVLVKPDPVAKPIVGCLNANPPAGIKPCTSTLPVQKGYSDFMRIDGRAVCLDTVEGLTDGTPPGSHKYKVRSPGNNLVSEL
ncbi:MAG: hypothetical protein QNK18_03710 [Gammaproteobacteria bacterium]|nr:hypothetical protein [Gammaproteobacteria bacterium]